MPLDPSEYPPDYVPIGDPPRRKRGRPPVKKVIPDTNKQIPPTGDGKNRPALRKSSFPKHIYVNGIQVPVGSTEILVFDTQLIELARKVKRKDQISNHNRLIIIAAIQYLRDNGPRIQDEWRLRAAEITGTDGHGIANWRKKPSASTWKEGEGVG